MRSVPSATKLSVTLCVAGLALTGCSSDNKGSSGASPSKSSSSSASASAGAATQNPVTVTRLGDALKITDNGISPEKLQKDVTTPLTKAAADKYVATVKPDEAWAKQLASRFGQSATVASTMNKQKEALDRSAQAAPQERVFPARCTDMWHITDAVSRPTGSTFASIHTADDKVSLIYSKLGKNTMPITDVFKDYMTCPDFRVASGDGKSTQGMLQILPLKFDDGSSAFWIRRPEIAGGSTYIYVGERNGVRLTAVGMKNDVDKATVENAMEHGFDLLPTTPAPGTLAPPHKTSASLSDISADNGPGQPLSVQPTYSDAWTKTLLSTMGLPRPATQASAEHGLPAFLAPYLAAEYNRTLNRQECLPSSDLEYVSLGGGISAERPINPKLAWFLKDDGSEMVSLATLKGSAQHAPLPLDEVFANASKCTSVTFDPYLSKPYTVSYSFGSFTTSSGQKAYTRTTTGAQRDVEAHKFVAMTDVDGVRVAVWSNTESTLKTDLEKAMKAAKQQPTS